MLLQHCSKNLVCIDHHNCAGLKVEAVVAADSVCSGKAVDYTWTCISPDPCTIIPVTSQTRRVLSLQSSALAGMSHGDAFTLQVTFEADLEASADEL